ncbi:hypothetical protein [Amorphus orientalis]|uniref:Uncharacterized protein n=1 Tax=Amorphus orientalis TaxID=649198 RepID=A0AAE3VSQ5_9HYPH|nr:hypothetical protein [Amorphus orientalis]MDQ0317719.1 hypothetical protein [Amorphus orientalis]
MKQFAVHTVHYAENGIKKVAKPGSTFDIDDKTAGDLKAVGASRDLTSEEVELEEFRSSKSKPSAPKTGKTEKTEGGDTSKTTRVKQPTAPSGDEGDEDI